MDAPERGADYRGGMRSALRAWLGRPGPTGVDGAVALLVAGLMSADLYRTGFGELSPPVVVVVALIVCLVVAWRREHALVVAAVGFGGNLGLLAYGFVLDNFGLFVSHLLASYALGAHTHGRAASPWVGAGAVLAAGTVAVSVVEFTEAAGMVLLLGLFYALGRTLRSRDRTVEDLRTEAERLAAGREERVARAVAEERARIARELHDVVAHSVSLMVLQTGAGRKVLASEPEAAQAMFRSAEETGRSALAEVKRLVGIMRTDETDLAPQPGLADLPELAASAAVGGKRVILEAGPASYALPPGLDLAAFRIVQEALTNSIRHAGPSSAAQVCVDHRADGVALNVSDEGPPGGLAWPPDEPGHGLVGMRERTALYGGRIDIGPNDRGGLTVSAWLPVEPAT